LLTARQQAASKRAAREWEQRLQQAIEQLPELERRQAERSKKVRERQPRVSTTEAEARRMKMPNGGFNRAVNVQLATDTESRGGEPGSPRTGLRPWGGEPGDSGRGGQQRRQRQRGAERTDA
jgi:hypothetical protein